MVYCIVVILSCILGAVSLEAQEAPAASVSARDFELYQDPNKKDFKLGETLQVKVASNVRDKLVEQLKNVEPSTLLHLVLDGVVMAGIPVDAPRFDHDGNLILGFSLVRFSEREENRKTWDDFFAKRDAAPGRFPASVLIGKDIPKLITSEMTLRVSEPSASIAVFVIGFLAFALGFGLLVRSPTMLRDSQGGTYSLGKCQMAFWGMLVLVCFCAIWSLTTSMERIPPKVLVLLGISGATGLSAVLIRDSKLSETKEALRVEKNKLSDLQSKGALTPGDTARLAKIDQEIDALKPQSATPSKGFFQDLCDDGYGMSFHRLQVVIWTSVLGGIFVHSICESMSMPEYSETLLVLQGISNGTYIGFKFPEKV